MLHRTRPATASGAPRPLSTGNLLADCERWCRDVLPPRSPRSIPLAGRVRTTSLRAAARALAATAAPEQGPGALLSA